jgi:hypothetical protein
MANDKDVLRAMHKAKQKERATKRQQETGGGGLSRGDKLLGEILLALGQLQDDMAEIKGSLARLEKSTAATRRPQSGSGE